MKKALSPILIKQWHPTKNGDSKPEGFTPGSSKIKIWWKCPKGDDHEWEATIKDRTRGGGCPCCSGQKVCKDNNLFVKFPEIAKQWHPTLNGDSKPEGFTPGSSKIKIWWKCPKGDDHEWDARIRDRTSGDGCPYCSGNKVGKDNNLLFLFPEIAKQWHPTLNGDSKPEDFTPGSGKKPWWKCPKGDDHEWEATIDDRTSGKGCPCCSGQKVCKDNNLFVKFPEIAKQWHPTLNGDSKPEDVTAGSSKKVSWKCPKGDDHEWEATINDRTSGHGCPKCTNQTSAPEIRILTELRFIFDDDKVISRYKVEGREVDIYLPEINLAIEYDGYYFHKDKEDSDREKNCFFESKNIPLMRVRHSPLKKLSEQDLVIKNETLTKSDLNLIVANIRAFVPKNTVEKLDVYENSETFLNDEIFKKYLSYFPNPFPEDSLLIKYPEIAEEWHPTKNYPLTPKNFPAGSGKKVSWKCPKGDDHEWEATITGRTSGKGCPCCSGNKVCKDNNLFVKFPEVAKQWHPTLNGDLKPEGFTPGSNKKPWWKCPKGDDHVWEARIKDRTSGKGCPYCSGNKVCKDNNLFVKFPEIAKQWHPTLNGNSKPENFTPGSNKKPWWKCPKGDDHEWDATIKTRTSGTGCPTCYKESRRKRK